MDPKKRRERFLLERFIEASALPAQVVEEREAPDFVVRFEGRSIGVELTELFVSHDANGRLPQAQERIATGIVSRAQQLYIASGARPMHVSLCFGPHSDLTRVDRHEFAGRLCRFVQGLKLQDWQRFVWHPHDGGESPPDAISYLQALAVPTHDVGLWTVARAGWVAPITTDVLQPRIDDKAKRLERYKVAVPETWLVVVADCTKPSQLFEVRSDFDPRAVSSPFTRTFYFGYPDRATVELGSGA